ncbi:MAG: glycogen/starch/alpha-glucan phosphorylase [Candidatus Omnitrophica bacterium]|nr:glycogen/starch/alpha-glucan phosphorylase [Candidatus Omnitrophota bacterium]
MSGAKHKDMEWITVQRAMTKEGIKISFKENRQYIMAKDQYSATAHDNYMSMAIAIRDRVVERWILTQERYHKQKLKRVYYLSLEFLIGRLLGNNVLNLGIWDPSWQALQELGFDPEQMRDEETDAGLGNGGLGRLAACFLDSMATLGIPGYGYGIRYDYGIFNQRIENGFQVECPDEWLQLGNPWEFVRPEYAVRVRFYGHTRMYHDRNGKLRVEWYDTKDVLAEPYDMPVPGYKNDVVNTLRLWSARSPQEFDFEYFNDGDYERAVFNQVNSESISKVLYPNDMLIRGKELRLKQEYFFTAASISDILRRFKADHDDIRLFPKKNVIQLNDTHPALAIIELLRILIDDEDLDWDTAWQITTESFAYTNHTVMPEALEKWTVPMLQELLPRHVQLIFEINHRFLREVANRFPWDNSRLGRMSIIEESNPKQIRMAHLSIIGSHAVNGVSELHSQLLKDQLFKDFYELWPEKFQNKTNGITPRRWLRKANPSLSDLIIQKIGDGWVTRLDELEKLLPYAADRDFQRQWRQIKEENKKNLAAVIKASVGISVNPQAIFDVQVKRIHEYKRQLMLCLYTIAYYLKVKNNSRHDFLPRVFIFSGKAAPGYAMAKMIIKFITRTAEIINDDRGVRGLIKVVFLPNYRVSLAERIFPGSDLSEQISLAGTEASGTGCMKFMLNGALTIGTLDGANIEMKNAVGDENMFIFGLNAAQVQDIRGAGYNPLAYIQHSPALKEIVALLKANFFSPLEPGLFDPILRSLTKTDPYLVCADFDLYCAAQERVAEEYRDPELWTRKSIINTAKSGYFSSDRTIAEYARDIWDTSCTYCR